MAWCVAMKLDSGLMALSSFASQRCQPDFRTSLPCSAVTGRRQPRQRDEGSDQSIYAYFTMSTVSAKLGARHSRRSRA